MKKTALQIVAALSLLFAGCSSLVKADRSKVPDDLYRPADFGDGGDAAGEGEVDAGEVDAGTAPDGGADLNGGSDAPSPADAGDDAGADGLLDGASDLPSTG
jgi:hypothetical protein